MGEGWVVGLAFQERLEKELKFLEWLGFVGVQLSADLGASPLCLCQGGSGSTCEVPWRGTCSAKPALYSCCGGTCMFGRCPCK